MHPPESLDGRPLRLRYSRGSGVPYLETWEDNVLRPPGMEAWPPAVLRQVNGYVARRSWFAAEDAEALSVRLGRISKFQSVNSEDAVTWSWFGTLGCAAPETQRAVVQWLYDRLDLDVVASTGVAIDQWQRVIHPNAPSRRGPELDARIDDPDGALIYVEAKWDATLGTGEGAIKGSKDDQIILRRDAFRAEPRLHDDKRTFVVLGISNTPPDLTTYEEKDSDRVPRPVIIDWLTWDVLAQCDAHPLAAEFRRYLNWKRTLAMASGREARTG